MNPKTIFNCIAYLGLSLLSFSCFAQNKSLNLSSLKWTFNIGSSHISFPARVPGCQYTDLLHNKLIANPYEDSSFAFMQAIAKIPFTYNTHFEVSENDLAKANPILIFKGLDTYAKVYLNGQLILSANNMHRSWSCEVKPWLKVGLNFLSIRFEPITAVTEQLAKKQKYTLPGGEYVFVRKAAYQFGWDWATRFLTAGIWKDIELVWQAENEIKHTQFVLHSLTDSLAKASYKIVLSKPAQANTTVELNINHKEIKKVAVVASGQKEVTIDFEIVDPHFWWCNGMGSAYLYEASLTLNSNHQELDQTKTTFGLRTLEWVQTPDDSGSSFYLKLNGYPVFMKGANWVPANSFLSEVNKENYTHLLQLAADANLNMLRVWGGGVYEQDEFYEQCDKQGILVWQDFMFACAMYPGDTAFMSNVAAEAEEQIIRLRNHPSLALWCGNNESDEGWHNWGWQKQYGYSYVDSSEIWHNYQILFHQLLPSKVEKLDAARYYHPSSPANGWGRAKAYKTGDVHYWGVWWGDEPFKKYEEKVGRFVSEYGFQGFPSSVLLHRYLETSDLHLTSPNLLAFQKHPRGFELIKAQMVREGIKPNDSLLVFAHQSALLQAKGIEMAIDAHRRNMPYCMGSLFWQWNDCWPSISWSAIDFIGKPKPVYYAVKRAFKPIRQQCIITKDSVQFLLISDQVDSLLVTAKIQIYDVTGQSLLVQTEHLSIGWGVNSMLLPNVAAFVNTKDTTLLLMRIEVKEGEKVIDTRDYQLGNWEEESSLDIQVVYDEKSYKNKIVNTGKLYQSKIWLELNERYLDENSFDLLPGESKYFSLKKIILNHEN